MDSREHKQVGRTWRDQWLNAKTGTRGRENGHEMITQVMLPMLFFTVQFPTLDMLNLESQNTHAQQADANVHVVAGRIIDGQKFQVIWG